MSPLGTPSTGVVVTGGGSGIGRAICLALADEGRPVSPWDIDGGAAARTAAECSDRRVAAHAAEIDVRDRVAIAEAAVSTAVVLGTIGGLVHAAGIVRPVLTDVIDTDTWDDVLAVNLRAEADLVQALLPAMRAAMPGSAIVGIASIEAIIGHGAIPSYCASKAGLLGLTRALAHRLGPEGIRVNAVCPGFVDTPMLAPAIFDPAARRRMEEAVPLRRLAAPDDIAHVVRFLLSDEAGYVHGATIVVDGGVTAVGGQH